MPKRVYEDDMPKWPPLDPDWDENEEPDAPDDEFELGEVTTQPWEAWERTGREGLLMEARRAASAMIRVEHWAKVVRSMPDGVESDIRSVTEKLRQIVAKLS